MGGPGGYDNARLGMWAYVDSDDRRTLSAMMFGFYMRDSYGSSMVDVNPSVRLRPTSALTLRAGFRWSRNINDSQWIENVDDGVRERYVFGHVDQKTAALTFRLEYTLSPTLSLQLYAEPFVSNGTYWNFKELVAGRAEEYEDRYQPYAYQDDPNFRYTSFRTTNVLRWEYRPGSTLYVVWQQGREDSDTLQGFDLGRDFGHVFNVPASNVFLVKLGYWLNR